MQRCGVKKQPFINNKVRVFNLWVPQLCLVGAGAGIHLGKKDDRRIVRLAGALYLLALATSMHWCVREEQNLGKDRSDLQYRVLVGDLLYGSVLQDLCRYDFQQYIPAAANLIRYINEELLLKDIRKRQHQSGRIHEINIMAGLGETACGLGAHTLYGETRHTNVLQKLGFQLGILQAQSSQTSGSNPCRKSWVTAWEQLEQLPRGEQYLLLKRILEYTGDKLQLIRPKDDEIITTC